jgi:hypothetical protein
MTRTSETKISTIKPKRVISGDEVIAEKREDKIDNDGYLVKEAADKVHLLGETDMCEYNEKDESLHLQIELSMIMKDPFELQNLFTYLVPPSLIQAIQFGYTTMFAMVNPLSAPIGLILNFLDLNFHSWIQTYITKRKLSPLASNIGIWEFIFKVQYY